ncbi:MAG: glycosyltransferase [Loktanella sp.]|nr:glycosyltransferase [Loktanella sp.]
MRTVHVVFEAPLKNGSGAQLRNLAVSASLSFMGPTSLIVVQYLLPDLMKNPERRPSFVEARFPAHVVDAVAKQVRHYDPDYCIVEGVYLSQISDRLLLEGQKVAVDLHNIESALQQDIDRVRYGWRAGLLYRRRWALASEAERRLAAKAHRVWVCSSHDAASLLALGEVQTPIDVVPNPVPPWCHDHDHNHAHRSRPVSEIHALFVGHLGYAPNTVAVKRLVKRIFPGIRTAHPAAKLEICGRTPPKWLKKLLSGQPSITLVANPESLAPSYERASVALIPLTEGGGTRLKILEAMALGVPVIATKKAVEGLDVVPGQTFLEAETDADFVEACTRLTEQPALWKRLADQGRAFAVANHSQAVLNQAVHASLAADT